jgi:protein O-GlcNAc transferase
MNRQQRRALAKGGRPAVGGVLGDAERVHLEALLGEAARCYQAGRFDAADRACRQVLAVDPHSVVALHISGLVALQAGANETAADMLVRAIALNPGLADLHAAAAVAFDRLGRFDEALDYYRRALALDPADPEALYNCGNLLLKLKRYDDAIEHYSRATALAPQLAEAFNNRGHALFALKRCGEALADFEHALAIKPGFVSALANRGAVLIELRWYDEGVASCEAALALDPRYVPALANRANGLFELRRFPEAARDFERVLALDPDYDYAAGRALYSRLLTCDWTEYERDMAAVARKVASGGRAAIPFMFLNMSDSVAERRQCAETFSRDKYPAGQPIWRGERYAHDRIRVAYLSADFRQHPMAYSMAGLFDAHDRSGFETLAISFGPDPQDAMRRRLESAFDRFLDVRTMADRDIALLLRELEVDIAVDLMGYTNNCRPAILTPRPAPVQVNYIGFAGTMGAEYIDYIMADRFVIPESARSYYSEQVVYLPDTYWPTDNRLQMGEAVPSRTDAGLPETGFVFCCFNQSYKIAPPMFDVWMRLLRQVDGSVLWLVQDNAEAERNLRREAERRGIAPARLVFAPRVPIGEYLARFRLSDLFLDTLPFNAHTTASDALWAGLPLVTCAGSSFASRVAGSVLSAIGLPELITTSLADYEALALRLARDGELFGGIKTALARHRDTFPLFDTERFSRHIERAYRTMWDRYQRGEPPAGFSVEPIA